MQEVLIAVTTEKKQPFTEDDVHDYVDGRMDGERRRRFEVFLSQNPAIAEVVADYQRQNELLRELFDRTSGIRKRSSGRGRLN